jgi:thiamine biosynthesis lipoprotein
MIMGTAVAIDIVGEPADVGVEVLADAAFAWFTEVDERFSTYKPDSEVNRIDRGELAVSAASPDMRHVLRACEELRSATNGYFDAYASRHLDPSGYVKGWSVQVASDSLVAAGAANHCVNAGGDIRVRGVGRDGQAWRIGIAHPWESDKVAWVVTGTNLAIATSGTYERGLHVIDPFRGEPATYLRSVTVTGPDLAIADAYATAALAMGQRGIDWLPTLVGYESAVVTQDGDAFRSDGLPIVAAMPAGDGDHPAY